MMYSSFQAADILGMKFTAFRDRMERGFIEADIPANGLGTKSFYSIDTLYKAKAAMFLEAAGLGRKEAAEHAQSIGYWKERISSCKRVGPVDILIDTYAVVKSVDAVAAKYE